MERLHGLAVVTKFVAGEVAEQFQDPGRGGRGAGAELGVERDVAGPGVGHGSADLAFDERAGEQREVVAAEQGLDACRVVQQQRVGVLGALEQVVTSFQVRLVAVGRQDVGDHQAEGR